MSELLTAFELCCLFFQTGRAQDEALRGGYAPGRGASEPQAANLHQPPLVEGTQDEERVGRPLDVLDLVQACVQLADLEGAGIPDH